MLLSYVLEFGMEITSLSKSMIPRQVKYFKAVVLHGFSDASERASEPAFPFDHEVKMIRFTSDYIVQISIAPLKIIFFPKLELCGTVLLARLMVRVKQAL